MYRPSPFLCIASPLLASALMLVCLSAGATTDWLDFRGPSANGHAASPGDAAPLGLPLTWSESEHVTWKTALPHEGWSTPVVLDGVVWLTTATPEGNDFFVIAVNAETGEILHSKQLFHVDDPEPLNNNVNGFASPSPVAEPGRVYVHFGAYGTACLDSSNGEVVWKRDDMPCRHYRGPGSSPILFEDLLILTFDGVDQQYVTALKKDSGETVWRTDRSTKWNDLDENGQPKREGDLRKAYSTPIVVNSGGRQQLISPGSSAIFSYDPRTGKERWMIHCPGFTIAARPVFGDGLTYVTTGRGHAALWAVRTDGEGELDESHVSWKIEGPMVPQEPSPVLVDGLLYLVSNKGTATCLDAVTGEEIWRERIGGNYMASPLYADGRLYFCTINGKTTVLKAGRNFEELATNQLDSDFMSCPVVSGSALILRSKNSLYRIDPGK